MQLHRAYVGGVLQPGTALVIVCFADVTLPSRSTTPTVAGCRLVGCSVVSRLSLRSRVVAGVLLHVCVCLGPVLSSHAEEGCGMRSGPGEARTILLLHIISVRPLNSLVWYVPS